MVGSGRRCIALVLRNSTSRRRPRPSSWSTISSPSTFSPILLLGKRGFSSRFFSISTTAPTYNSSEDFLTRVSDQLPHMVQHILPENPSLQYRWQQEVSYLQRRHQKPQQTFNPTWYRLQEWQEWCCRAVREDMDDALWHIREYGPWLGELPSEWCDITAAEIDVVSFQDAIMALTPNADMLEGLSYATTAIFRCDAEIITSHQIRKQALFNALALLRVMIASDWAQMEDVEEQIACNNDNDYEGTEIATQEEDSHYSDDMPDDIFLDQLHAFSKQTDISTDDRNLLLARLALALDLERDDVASLLMHEFTSMCQSTTPDAISYEILLSTLVHRLHQFDPATQVVEHMMQNHSLWTPECLTAAMHAYNGRGMWDYAWDLLQTVFTNPAREFKIQNKTFQVMMELALSEQRSYEVLRIMEMAMKETRRRSDTNVEKILLLGLTCSSTKDRHATEFLTKVMTIFEEPTVMVPSDRVWRHFICVVFGRRRGKDKVLGQLIRQAFHNWALYTPTFRPSDSFLNIGLVVSESLRDAEFAADLVLRCLRRDGNGRKVATTSIPILQIIRAVNICIESGDVHRGRLILDQCISHPNIHTAMKQKMYASVLRGYSEAGDTVAARQLLSGMAESSIPINQDNLAVMIRTYALRKDLSSATLFLTAVEDGIFEVEPDASIYGSYILTCVRVGAWQEAMDTYAKLKEQDLMPAASTVYCLLLAANKVNGVTSTEEFLQDIVQSNAQVDMACCFLACSLLLRELPEVGSMKELRTQLRHLTDCDEAVREESLHLLKELRMAELDRGESSDRWRQALSSLLNLVRAMNRKDDSTQYSVE